MAPSSPAELKCTTNSGCTATSLGDLPSVGYPLPTMPPAAEGELQWVRRCVKVAVKGFAIGSGLKGSLVLFSVLILLRSRCSPRVRKVGAMCGGAGVKALR
ncbi:hypothetical protein E2562_036456 [Oryza meyeriana var. granulata]|uniref:Uncharacterized protein n=1 Tax=Oryza meyeriana var. granulata TaxID=110450 RepID=A0A6G1D9Q4_9ORYZ|nr:hypothetical protein E2562_036456 [Oryza meyeriana var. granulata]